MAPNGYGDQYAEGMTSEWISHFLLLTPKPNKILRPSPWFTTRRRKNDTGLHTKSIHLWWCTKWLVGLQTNMLHCWLPSSLPANPASKPKNVILFGETGIRKSLVVNLMAGRYIAKVSSCLEGCTLQTTEYFFTLSGCLLLHIYDTVGLEESEMDANAFISTIEKAQKVITSLKKTGNIDLLLFCIKAGRFTASMQWNYHLFSEILCNNHIPLAFIITHLENEDVMENWWERNEKMFKRYGINTVTHACITTVMVPSHVISYMEKWVESRHTLQKLFLDTFRDRNPPSHLQGMQNLLFTFSEKCFLFLMSRRKMNKVTKKLRTYCALPCDEAQRLVKLIMKGWYL